MLTKGQSLSGLEFFTAWKTGDLIPPMAATLGFELVDFTEGRVEVGCVPSDYHYNPHGTVHGGLAATLIDTATGCAVHTRLPVGTGYATVNLNISYLRPSPWTSGRSDASERSPRSANAWQSPTPNWSTTATDSWQRVLPPAW